MGVQPSGYHVRSISGYRLRSALSSQGLIGQQHFVPADTNCLELLPPHDILEMSNRIFAIKYVFPLWLEPKFLKLRIADENVWRPGSVGAGVQIIETPIHKQGGPIPITEHRREPIVVSVDGQISLGRVLAQPQKPSPPSTAIFIILLPGGWPNQPLRDFLIIILECLTP